MKNYDAFVFSIIVVFAALEYQPTFAAVTCFTGQSENSTIPADAENVTCTSMCYKMYNSQRTVDILPPYDAETSVFYSWGCADEIVPFSNALKCGDVFEDGYAGPYIGYNVSLYGRMCTCCGDKCNDAAMDGKCNEEPVFTKQCYSAGRTESLNGHPSLPDDAVALNCTDNQTCFKMSVFTQPPTGPNSTNYVWGCTTLLGSLCNYSGVHPYEEDGNVEQIKLCACCGGLCNGPEMDGIVASDTQCSSEMTSSMAMTTWMTEMPASTTKPPEKSSDNSAAVVGAVLGTFLALALVVVGVLGYIIYREKYGSGAGVGGFSSGTDKTGIIQDSASYNTKYESY